MQSLLPYVINGISAGGQYALIAIGYTLVYGILRLINFAHGDVFMVAGLMMIYFTASLPMYLALPLVVVCTALLGFLIERAGVYQQFEGGLIQFSLPETFANLFGEGAGTVVGILIALLIGGLIAALMAYLIGLPVLRLKSDYLAIATLGFAEILRAFFQWNALGPITNGSNLLKGYPDFGHAWAYLILIAIFIGIILLMVNSTYGRAFKAIRDDEVAAEAMGINLAHHKRLAFVISSFFAGVGGGMLAMYMGAVQALSFKSTMTYEILLIVVIGGIGSITGSVITSFLYIASVEWLLRGLDSGEFLGIQAPGLFKNGFRMAIVSVIIMLVVLFFRKGIMGDRELTDLLRRKPRKEGK